MPRFKSPGTKTDLPVGIFLDFERGMQSGKSVLCQFYGGSCVNLYSQSTWTAVEYSLRVFTQIPDDEPWGRIQWGNNAWDAIEVKDKWEFLERYITPIIEQGRLLVAEYDEITRKSFERCDAEIRSVIQSAKDRAIAVAENLSTTLNPPKMKRRKVDPAEVHRLREEGLTQKQIAEKLGCSDERVRQILKLDPNSYYHGNMNLGNTSEPPKSQGNNSEYLMARLARDYPEVVERVKAGEFPSVRAAAVAAGIVPSGARMQFTVGPTTTPQAFAGSLFERLEPEFLNSVVTTLMDALGR